MIKRTTEQWLALFESQTQSGQSQAQFCKAQGLCAKHFSLRKRQLLGQDENPKFTRVQRTQSDPKNPAHSMVEWQLQIGEMRLRVFNVPVEHMVHLLKGLT